MAYNINDTVIYDFFDRMENEFHKRLKGIGYLETNVYSFVIAGLVKKIVNKYKISICFI